MRFRITMRGVDIELRGYVDGIANAQILAAAVDDMGLEVIASLADDDYDPFKEQELRELHHFETEQENERLANELAQATNNHTEAVRKYRQRQEFIRALREEIKELRTRLGEQ